MKKVNLSIKRGWLGVLVISLSCWLVLGISTIAVSKISESVEGTVLEVVGVESSGNANSGNLFRYDDTNGQYIFNLSTKGFSQGTYEICATPDIGESYYVQFSLK